MRTRRSGGTVDEGDTGQETLPASGVSRLDLADGRFHAQVANGAMIVTRPGEDVAAWRAEGRLMAVRPPTAASSKP
jgi:hypothetical protein